MPKFSERSHKHLVQLHPYLQCICNEAILDYDYTIICSVRNKADQEEAFNLHRSKAHFGQSPHNYTPALAFDAIPYPFAEKDWENIPRFIEMAEAICKAAHTVGIPIIWGGSWKSFKDYPHFELVNWRTIRDKM